MGCEIPYLPGSTINFLPVRPLPLLRAKLLSHPTTAHRQLLSPSGTLDPQGRWSRSSHSCSLGPDGHT